MSNTKTINPSANFVSCYMCGLKRNPEMCVALKTVKNGRPTNKLAYFCNGTYDREPTCFHQYQAQTQERLKS